LPWLPPPFPVMRSSRQGPFQTFSFPSPPPHSLSFDDLSFPFSSMRPPFPRAYKPYVPKEEFPLPRWRNHCPFARHKPSLFFALLEEKAHLSFFLRAPPTIFFPSVVLFFETLFSPLCSGPPPHKHPIFWRPSLARTEGRKFFSLPWRLPFFFSRILSLFFFFSGGPAISAFSL